MRTMAPEAFCTSPQTSPSAPTAPAASTDSSRNCTSAPPVIRPVTTSCAPSHSTADTPPNTSVITTAVMPDRARMRPREASNAVSTAAAKRAPAERWRLNACTVSSWSRLSPAKPTASAKRSCAAVDRRRTRRPKMAMGATTKGTSSSTPSVSLGLTTSSSTTEPSVIRMLRRAMEAVVPTMLSTRVTSVVMRESTSPVRVCRKKAGSSVSMWA